MNQNDDNQKEQDDYGDMDNQEKVRSDQIPLDDE